MLSLEFGEARAFERLNAAARGQQLRLCAAHQAETPQPDVLVLSVAGSLHNCGFMVLVKVAERGQFTRAAWLKLNGIRGFVGPAPNERLGVIDVLVTGGMRAEDNAQYTGADLYADLLADREIALECYSQEHTRHTASTHLTAMDFARTTAYNVPLDEEIATLGQRSLFEGAAVMLNGGRGLITGSGSLCAPGRPSLSCAADCLAMDKALLVPKSATQPVRLALTMAFPLWRGDDATALLAAAQRVAACDDPETAAVLRANEQHMIESLQNGEMSFVDPGPEPFATILAGA